MEIRTDDDVYRVDSVWLGPPKATMPWHVRYVAWGIGLVVFFLVIAAERAVGIGFGLFSTGWGLVLTVAITRALARMINYERPLGAVLSLFVSEVRTPREHTVVEGGALRTARPLRIREDRPRPSESAPAEPVDEGLALLAEPVEAVPARPRGRVSLGRAWRWVVAPLWLVGFLTIGVVVAATRGVWWVCVWLWASIRRVRLPRPRRVQKPFPALSEPLPRRTVSHRGPAIEQYRDGEI